MATVTTQNPGVAGAAPSMHSASAGGDKVSPDTRLLVINGGGATVTLTIATPYTVAGLALDDMAIDIPNGSFPANAKFADVPAALYQQPSDGLCHLSWSTTTSVTFAVLGSQPA